ncbi:uncharacterized protein LOC130753133 isoform X2 [Actinidia eriantha]|uniref:uncharacterized protein LOC130753133 isoform X2 n=1 Tax=Actinidia eriantha TaxID=165200 RepID=UPI002588D36A|nr:uncharacterized protein LOC130753133 isoform X2 [Actinidia eriantha]
MEEDKITELMIENNVLECVEGETEVWKSKCRELELRVLELEKEILVLRGGPRKQTTNARNLKDGLDVVACLERFEAEDKMVSDNETIDAATGINSTSCSLLKGIGDLEVAGTPAIDMPIKQSKLFDGRRRVRKSWHLVKKTVIAGRWPHRRLVLQDHLLLASLISVTMRMN